MSLGHNFHDKYLTNFLCSEMREGINNQSQWDGVFNIENQWQVIVREQIQEFLTSIAKGGEQVEF